jgi:hypothetical protein
MPTRIKGSQIRDDSVDGSKIADDSLTGDDIDESTLVMTLDDILSDGASTTVTMNTGSIIPSSNSIYDLGSGSNVWDNAYIDTVNVSNQLIVSSTESELIRLQKTDAETRYFVFESDGVDKFEMYLNNFENFVFTTTDTTDDIVFRLNGHSAIYMNGYPKEVRIWDTYNSAYNTKINSSLEINGTAIAKSYKDTVFTITDGASVDIDPDNGGIQVWTLGANRSPTASNFDAGARVMLMINDGSSYSITWPSVNWVGGVAPTLPTSGYGIIELWKVESQLYGAFAGGVA